MKKRILALASLCLCVFYLSGCVMTSDTNIGMQTSENMLVGNEEISYVMIYNPHIYDENVEYNELRNTGNFASSVEAIVSRADELSAANREFVPRSFAENNAGFDFEEFVLEGNRSGMLIMPYKVGDIHEFYCGEDTRTKRMFTCRYAGTYCNIWTCDSSVTDVQALRFGQEFDTNIYTQTTSMFGKSRFADNGGKVNLLFYPMSQGLCGFFTAADAFATGEFSTSEILTYGLNLDHDIVHISSYYVNNMESVSGTMAHEFQHLICFTDYLHTVGSGIMMRTWLNEAMSGYVEEKLYPGTKEIAGHYDAFTQSSRIRHGQSMYNFGTSTTNSEWDIGVYGSVYLFSEYLAQLAGENVYSKVHSYWRNSYSSTLDEAEAIVKSVPGNVYSEIDTSIDFGDATVFNDADDAWLSKLTLNFYLSLLKYDANDPESYRKVQAQTLLYDEINPAEIEGGGRVIVALKNGQFEFPTDADKGLVYVGFNKNFEIVTDYVIR